MKNPVNAQMVYALIPVILVVLTLSLAGCGESSTPTTTKPVTTSPTGAQLYSANCASCHGVNRQGGVGPNVTPTSPRITKFTETSLINHIAGHQTGRSLSNAQQTSLAAYLMTP